MGLTMTVEGIGRGIRRSSAGGSSGDAMPEDAAGMGGGTGLGSSGRFSSGRGSNGREGGATG
jgi:hypothetical protein